MITKYAIIDHVGSLTQDELSVYNKVYTKANSEGYNKTNLFTMKKFCQMNWNPYSRKPMDADSLRKMKFAVRHQKNPEKVYFVCPEMNYTTEREVQKWHDRGIQVHIYEVHNNTEYDYQDFYDTHQFDFDGKASINRRLAEIWAPAFGISFSAPITRIQYENNIENFSKRSDHDDLIAAGETHYSKPFTSHETFLEMTRCVATNDEIADFRVYLDAYITLIGGSIVTKLGPDFGTYNGNPSALQEFLNPDYIICEACGRPMRVHTGDCECPHCQTKFTEDIVLSAYYEDSYEEEMDE